MMIMITYLQEKIMKHTKLFILLTIILLSSCTGDSFRDHIRRGNRNYEEAVDTLCQDSSYIYEACTEYDRAIQKDSLQAIGHYNKANAYLYLNDKDSTAFSEYMTADSLENDFTRQAHIHRNIGVLLQRQSLNAPDSVKYNLLRGAVENYKTSLRYDPQNHETRYNLALCQWQLKKEPQDNNGGGGGQGDNQDQNQDQQQQQQDQQQQQQDQQKQEQQQQQQKQQQQASEQMIQAAMERERETQNRMNQYEQAKRQEEEQAQSSERRLQKNW